MSKSSTAKSKKSSGGKSAKKRVGNAEEIAKSICDEIIKNTMYGIVESYYERQTVDFIVDCACEALKNVLQVEFYFHNPYPDMNCRDLPRSPVCPDSWSINQMSEWEFDDSNNDLVNIDITEYLTNAEPDVSEVFDYIPTLSISENLSESLITARSRDSAFDPDYSDIVVGNIKEPRFCPLNDEEYLPPLLNRQQTSSLKIKDTQTLTSGGTKSATTIQRTGKKLNMEKFPPLRLEAKIRPIPTDDGDDPKKKMKNSR